MYGGSFRDILPCARLVASRGRERGTIPRGPSISRVFGASSLVSIFFRFTGGSRSRRLTSAGSDRGSEPTRDAHREELENGCDVAEDMAGTRKSGNEMTDLCDNLKRPARLLVAAMSYAVVFCCSRASQDASNGRLMPRLAKSRAPVMPVAIPPFLYLFRHPDIQTSRHQVEQGLSCGISKPLTAKVLTRKTTEGRVSTYFPSLLSVHRYRGQLHLDCDCGRHHPKCE